MTQRTWFITGASSGFGRQFAEILLQHGHRVAATARNIESLVDLSLQYAGSMWIHSLDVSETESIRQVVAAAFSELGQIDVVVNNAGSGLVGAAEEFSDDQIVRLINTNLIGSIQVIRAVLPYFRAQGGGHIIQMASMAGQIGLCARSAYVATKWGIEGFVESVIPEVAPFGIRITLIEPGSTRTSFDRNAAKGNPMTIYDKTLVGELRRGNAAKADPGDPAKMVRAIIDLVEKDRSPCRLTLGSDAYHLVHEALTARLAELEAQRDLACSTDVDD